MKISLEWLKDYVDLPKTITLNEIEEKLTLHTAEVEEITTNLSGYDRIVIGVIKEVTPHPNADKLKICLTDVGDEVIKIVCGGTNVKKGLKVVVAKIGAKVLWHGEKEMIMEQAKLRGEDSFGMICSNEEVGLKGIIEHEDGEICDLKDFTNLKEGDSVTDLLGGQRAIIDIDNKAITNRPDLWSHFGFARELSAIFNVFLKKIDLHDIKFLNNDIMINIVAKDRCPRFSVVKISGLEWKDSPEWMKKRLLDCGVRPISNIVDVTNYVMLELGQPMHAYDADKITGGFSVKMSEKDQKFTTLDGVERTLTGEEVLVCDNEKILGLGGVMGGQTSEVSATTNTIYLESANWTASPIRKTGATLGLRTEAVQRYEKSLDLNLTEQALRRAINLLQELNPNLKIESSFTDVKNSETIENIVLLNLNKLNTVLGTKMEPKEIKDILHKLDFEVTKETKEDFLVKIPSFRLTGDISIAEDLIEEIARLRGYFNIEEQYLNVVAKAKEKSKMNQLENEVRLGLKNAGFDEVMTYSFLSRETILKFKDNIEDYLEIMRPFSQDHQYIRRSLVQRVLEVVSKNKSRSEMKLFEIGHVHWKEKKDRDDLPFEDIILNVTIVRKKVSGGKDRNMFFNVKGVLAYLLKSINLEFTIEEKKDEKELMDNDVLISVKNKKIGQMSTFRTVFLEEIGLKGKEIGFFELSLRELVKLMQNKISYKPLSKYPNVVTGLSLVCPEGITIEKIVKKIKNAESTLIKEIKVVDIYRGEQIKEGYKSVVIDVVFEAPDRTLSDGDVSEVNKKILTLLSADGITHR